MKEYTVLLKLKYPYVPKFEMEKSIEAAIQSTFYARGFTEVEVNFPEVNPENDLSS